MNLKEVTKVRKIISLFVLLAFTIAVLNGCSTNQPDQEKTTDESSEQSVDDLDQELDSVEEDLALEDFDELDEELNEVDTLDY